MIFRPTLTTLALAVAALSCSVGAAQAAEYEYHHRVAGLKAPQVQSWSLAPAELPEAQAGKAYSYSFSNLITDSSLTGFAWNTEELPAWARLDGQSGQLTGTPSGSDIGSSQFTVTATRQGTNGQQIYTIVVGGQVLEVSQLALGHSHTCVVTAAGGAKCWGSNADGQLGNGSQVNSPVPVDVIGLNSGVTSIAAGYRHSCAVTTAGAVKCWGGNPNGQLGNGSTNGSLFPANVSGLSSGVASVSARGHHSCALTTARGVKCWGNGYYGQLGNGGTSNATVPVNVTGLSSGVAMLSAGNRHTCVVTTAGAAKCWGSNQWAQLGNGTKNNSTTPISPSGMSSGVSKISAYLYTTCAVTTAGAAKCWGYNPSGQVGDGTQIERLTPVNVHGLTSGVTDISANASHACALTQHGGVKCWGSASAGVMGPGISGYQLTPVDIKGFTAGVARVDTGYGHTCAKLSSGAIQCLGQNTSGQIGDGTTTHRDTPTDVLLPN